MLPVAAKTGVWGSSTSLPRSPHCAAQTNPEGQQSAGGCPSGKPSEEVEHRALLLFWLHQMEMVEEQEKGSPSHSITEPVVSVWLDKAKGNQTKVHVHLPLAFQVKYIP